MIRTATRTTRKREAVDGKAAWPHGGKAATVPGATEAARAAGDAEIVKLLAKTEAPIAAQCGSVSIGFSPFYRAPVPEAAGIWALMAVIDASFLPPRTGHAGAMIRDRSWTGN